jgi:hypothetical protein
MAAASGRADVVRFAVAFSVDGRFTSASLWPGRYLVRAAPPEGWQFKDATYQGRDISSRPIDVSADLDNIVITFIDKLGTIKGNVQVEPGSPVDDATVLMFPTDSALWVDFGRTNRMFASARVSTAGQFSVTLPPPGEYFIVAVPDESTEQWQSPEALAKLAPLAERLRVAGETSLTHSLQLKKVR